MNSMAFKFSLTAGRGDLRAWPLLILGLCLLLVPCASRAQEPLYQNLSVSQYYSPATSQYPLNSPPQIAATAFDNESTFEVSFKELNTKAILYEPSDTLFYTNGDNGLMIANAPLVTNLLTSGFETFQSYGSGFRFDDKTSNGYQWATTFYNSGTVRCNSILDGNNTYNFGGLFGVDYILGSVGTCYINASNIYNPGDIDLGVDSLLQIVGNTVDLSRGLFTIETTVPAYAGVGAFYNSQYYDNITLNSTGNVGTDTNGDWDPALDLTATNALSSAPDYLQLTNSAAYFHVDGPTVANPSNIIYRVVFVENNSPNASYNVYFDGVNGGSNLDPFSAGAAHVGWAGTYTDPATGNTITNYLYLTDDYALGASTNVQVLPGPFPNGFPDNFTLLTSATPLLNNPTPAGFQNVFYPGSVTNPYAYFNGQIAATTINTNTSSVGAGGITNISGRLEITALKELNMNNAVISGQNYLYIQATNQFDGSAGAQIASPFSDINIGVTNGDLEVTNLLESDIPNWSGTINAWSTRWFVVDPVTGITNDFRVLLVYSQLQPTTQPFIQNLALHSGTNLVISDVLNFYSTLFLDAQRLTVTTNGYGFGATSAEGELNGLLPGNIGPAQWPNLRWVTNNGTISGQNLLIFTNASTYGAVINNGVINDEGTTIYASNFLDSGTISNGIGNLAVISQTTTLTNGSIYAGGNVSIAANNFSATNTYVQCLSLTLNPSKSITDFGVPGNIWVVGNTNATGGQGFSLLNNPTNGDLLGTTITNICPPPNKELVNTWSGRDFGAVNAGYTNNSALGHLVLDTAGADSLITFNGSGSGSNALYVDCLELQGSLTNGLQSSYNFTNWLSLNTNITIYFAQAYILGVSVAEQIGNASLYQGENGGYLITNIVTGTNGVTTTNRAVVPGRLRWVPTYAGLFSSTNIVINGVTNTYNAALAKSKDIDSDGSGVANVNNPSPFFTAQQINFSLTVTNQPKRAAVLSWTTVPLATNSVYFSSSLLTNNWQLYTNFLSTNVLGPSYVTTVSDTNILNGTRFYKVLVQPWLTYPY
jgi:hypothetical protein